VKLLVLGATGQTGRHLVTLSLERGHSVTAFARSKFVGAYDRLEVVQGDASDARAIAAALRDHDSVLSAIGSGGLGATTVRQDAARAIVQAMTSAGVARVVVLSQAMLFPNIGRIPGFVMRTVFSNVLDDARKMEAILQDSLLRWTIVRAPRLTNGNDTHYHIARDALPPKGMSIARPAVAAAMFDVLTQPDAVHAVFGVAG
jgi:putative NADH-flavin reductase